MAPSATPREAAISLAEMLKERVPALSVGIGQDAAGPVLIVYLSRKIRPSESDRVPQRWKDFPVKTSLFGRVEPATGTAASTSQRWCH